MVTFMLQDLLCVCVPSPCIITVELIGNVVAALCVSARASVSHTITSWNDHDLREGTSPCWGLVEDLVWDGGGALCWTYYRNLSRAAIGPRTVQELGSNYMHTFRYFRMYLYKRWKYLNGSHFTLYCEFTKTTNTNELDIIRD